MGVATPTWAWLHLHGHGQTYLCTAISASPSISAMSAQILQLLLVHVLLEVAESLEHGGHSAQFLVVPLLGGEQQHVPHPGGHIDLQGGGAGETYFSDKN